MNPIDVVKGIEKLKNKLGDNFVYKIGNDMRYLGEILNIDDIACFILKKLHKLYPERLEERYGIRKLDEDLIETYDIIAAKRGALSRGGVADYEKVSNIIVRDLKNGYFGNITFDRLK